MWKTILLVLAVIFSGLAAWMLFQQRDQGRQIEFINCKTENVQAALQYAYCINALKRANYYRTHCESTPETPAPADAASDQCPGGMVTDQFPGGMVTDQQSGARVPHSERGSSFFNPTRQELMKCAAMNTELRESITKCGEALKKCNKGEPCEYPPPD